MSNDLDQKIVDDLEKSGFASEMKVVAAFRKHKWSCDSGVVYTDHDDNKSRELDFRGIHICSHGKIVSEYVILGEVKKAQNPWVVFKKNESSIPSFELLGGGYIVCTDNLPEQRAHTLARSKSSVTALNRWQGNGIHESFKNPDQPSRWFSAFVVTSKATGNHISQFDSFFADQNMDDYSPENPSYLGILKPVVIIDGNLFSAEFLDERLQVDEISYTTIKFEYESHNYSRRSYLVDLVSMKSLDEYIQLCEKQHNEIVLNILSGLYLENQEVESYPEMSLEEALETTISWQAGMPFFTFFS